jgi:hypothetical protein
LSLENLWVVKASVNAYLNGLPRATVKLVAVDAISRALKRQGMIVPEKEAKV